MDLPVTEQVIDVPKISSSSCPSRAVLNEPQLVEQLVEVPTIISYSSLQRITEQHVDIPVPRRGGRYPGLQGLLSRQSSTASQLALERISERIVEQIVDFPVSREGLQDFRPGQGSSSSSHVPARDQEGLDELGEGVFRTYPRVKKVRVPPRVRVRSCPGRSAHGLRRLMVCWWLWLLFHTFQCEGRQRILRSILGQTTYFL